MRKLIKRFKEWLIRKLGGQSKPFMVTKLYRPEPIKLQAMLDIPYTGVWNREAVETQLAFKIADEILDKKLFDLEHCTDDLTNTVKFRMTVLAVEPLERELERIKE